MLLTLDANRGIFISLLNMRLHVHSNGRLAVSVGFCVDILFLGTLFEEGGLHCVAYSLGHG